MKKFLLSLFVGFIGIISFCSAITFQNTFYCPFEGNCSSKFNVENIGNVLIDTEFNNNTYRYYYYNTARNRIQNETITTGVFDTSLGVKYYNLYANDDDYFLYVQLLNPCGGNSCTIKYTYTISGGSCPECPTCPEVDTGSILSGYVPEIDLLTCQSNYNSCQSDLSSCQSFTSGFNSELNNCSSNLNACNTSLTSCLQNNCPVISGDIQWSSLYINDIQHEGAGIVNVSIPEEFNWDYTNSGGIFDLNVEGYNVDTDYISGIIDTQNSKPSQSDLNKLVSEVLPLFIPGLAVILLLYFIFRFIKKIF